MKNRKKIAAVASLAIVAVGAVALTAFGSSYEKIDKLPTFKTYTGPGSLSDENQTAPGGMSFFLSEGVALPESSAVLWEIYYEHNQEKLGVIRDVLGADNMTLDEGAVDERGSVFHIDKNGEWWFSNPGAGVLCEERGDATSLKDSSGETIQIPGKCKKTAETSSQAAALERANAIIKAVGGLPENSEYYSDPESQSVTNNTNNMTTYVSFGAKGEVQYASGRLGVLREHGEWSLRDASKVIKDLGIKAAPVTTLPGCSKNCSPIPETKVEVVRVEVTHTTRQDTDGRTWVVPMYALYDAANVVWYAEAISGTKAKK
jgi:hypothetical protein